MVLIKRDKLYVLLMFLRFVACGAVLFYLT